MWIDVDLDLVGTIVSCVFILAILGLFAALFIQYYRLPNKKPAHLKYRNIVWRGYSQDKFETEISRWIWYGGLSILFFFIEIAVALLAVYGGQMVVNGDSYWTVAVLLINVGGQLLAITPLLVMIVWAGIIGIKATITAMGDFIRRENPLEYVGEEL